MTQEKMRTEAESAAESIEETPLRNISFYERSRGNGVDKAGTVPFVMESGAILFYLHKPGGSYPELGDPGFQIAKGTREAQNDEGEWVRYNARKHAKNKVEPLIVSALREGIEEAGLKTANIERLLEWGIATFKSATKSHEKSMWLYLAEMKDKDDFLEPDSEHGNTAECRWFDIETAEAKELIRPDHFEILQQIHQRLL